MKCIRRVATRAEVRRAAGNHIICGFDGTGVTAELKELVRETQPLGVILFARNVESPEQVSELCRELKMLRPASPLLVSVDQEGGRVARIRQPATQWPCMRDLGFLGDAELTKRVGHSIGTELRAMGIDANFAPVLDVDSCSANPVIGDRSFSADPSLVALHGAALAAGLRQAGVAPCGKHFPGHGDTDQDSHLTLPSVPHELDRLRAVEWVPFRSAIGAGLEAVMTAHLVVQAIDEDLPATLSARVLGYLRGELGFGGVVISDDLEMKAVADRFSPQQIAELGLNAGVDLFLACHRPEVVIDLYAGIVHAIEQEQVTVDALLDGEDRVVAWAKRYLRPSSREAAVGQVVGCGEHQALVQRITELLQQG